MIGIYKITSTVNNKYYIGQSRNIKDDKHLPKENFVQYLCNKYGSNNLKCEILEICKESELYEREQYWISFYKPSKLWSEESRHKLSESQKGCFINKNGIQKKIKYEELDEYISKGWTKGSLIHRAKDKNSMYGKKGNLCPNYGKKAINKNNKTKYINPNELDNFLSKGWKLGTDSLYRKRISESKSTKYIYNGIMFIGSYKIRDYLRNNGYPKISQNTIYKLSNNISVKGYESLQGKITIFTEKEER